MLEKLGKDAIVNCLYNMSLSVDSKQETSLPKEH